MKSVNGNMKALFVALREEHGITTEDLMMVCPVGDTKHRGVYQVFIGATDKVISVNDPLFEHLGSLVTFVS